ncbi:MAG: hypothetical protein LIO94_12365 [Clostridiales bacterium]|nr:hypothetical protein [Clostridiales bacterium]
MKIWVEKDNGVKIEATEIAGLKDDCSTLFFFHQQSLRPETVKEFETELKEKTGKNCVVLDGRYLSKILAV